MTIHCCIEQCCRSPLQTSYTPKHYSSVRQKPCSRARLLWSIYRGRLNSPSATFCELNFRTLNIMKSCVFYNDRPTKPLFSPAAACTYTVGCSVILVLTFLRGATWNFNLKSPLSIFQHSTWEFNNSWCTYKRTSFWWLTVAPACSSRWTVSVCPSCEATARGQPPVWKRIIIIQLLMSPYSQVTYTNKCLIDTGTTF